jgi:hydrogenase nickel incorporation protein HypA/HybF
MHELAIAQALIAIATKHADGRPVTKVEVRVGHLRQVVPSALEFAFELVARDTPVEGAELELCEVAAEGRCRACGVQTVMSGFPLACGRCGGLDMEVIAGEELSVEALELDVKEPDPPGGEELATIGGTG